ncbi:hypothetical protein [Leptolyngbya sp. FACHB-711]|uniref:hypothetical protein n=1 Tax=Leptolyngbya sp. FACHB-711 TaxID=2692813 RepID=UPI00168920BF|nr:hypothetical protein [Leptolyngbya sp. FACHB-711]MBD2027084.1 hypothetical protein [Leptolyngbya sp. FACHB-711]
MQQSVEIAGAMQGCFSQGDTKQFLLWSDRAQQGWTLFRPPTYLHWRRFGSNTCVALRSIELVLGR